MRGDLSVVYHDGVQTGLVQKQFLQHELFHHRAHIGDGHARRFHLKKLSVHIALKHDFIAHHGDDALELLELWLGQFWLFLSMGNRQRPGQ